jgi:predicted heme/steroid binding protein
LTRDDILSKTERKFKIEELEKYDGKGGRPAYIALKGKVYDVTGSDLWAGGEHQSLHEAGKDLTEEIADAPHGEEMLKHVKLVGKLAP